MKKQLYLITFGVGHPCERFVQPVLAENDLIARSIACRYFGTQWSICYGPDSYEEWPNGAFVIGKTIGPDTQCYEKDQQFGTLDQERETKLYGLYGEYWK